MDKTKRVDKLLVPHISTTYSDMDSRSHLKMDSSFFILNLSNTRNPASRASERVRLVAIRPSSYVHRICNFKDCKEGIYFMFFESVL